MKRAAPLTAYRGFTVVELLIVVVVIAIIAGVVIVAYNGIQNQARSSAVVSDLRQADNLVKMETLRNNRVTPVTLATADVSVPSHYTAEYWRYDSNKEYCVSYTLTGSTPVLSYHMASYKQDKSPQPGACSDAESAADGFLGYSGVLNESDTLSAPTDPYGNLTLYAAFEISSMDAAWSSMTQATAASGTVGRMQLDQNGPGSNGLRTRVDTTASSNFTLTQSGVRTNGRHVGWVQISENATRVSIAYDKAEVHASGTIPASDGISIGAVRLSGTSAGMLPLGTALYEGVHSEAERSRVMQWFAQKFSIPGTF